MGEWEEDSWNIWKLKVSVISELSIQVHFIYFKWNLSRHFKMVTGWSLEFHRIIRVGRDLVDHVVQPSVTHLCPWADTQTTVPAPLSPHKLNGRSAVAVRFFFSLCKIHPSFLFKNISSLAQKLFRRRCSFEGNTHQRSFLTSGQNSWSCR